jgi:cytidylate kinase
MTTGLINQGGLVATKKARVVAYLEPEMKERAEKLARSRKRSLSNLLEILIEREVLNSEQGGGAINGLD